MTVSMHVYERAASRTGVNERCHARRADVLTDVTGRIQFKVLTTLPLTFKGFYNNN